MRPVYTDSCFCLKIINFCLHQMDKWDSVQLIKTGQTQTMTKANRIRFSFQYKICSAHHLQRKWTYPESRRSGHCGSTFTFPLILIGLLNAKQINENCRVVRILLIFCIRPSNLHRKFSPIIIAMRLFAGCSNSLGKVILYLNRSVTRKSYT